MDGGEALVELVEEMQGWIAAVFNTIDTLENDVLNAFMEPTEVIFRRSHTVLFNFFLVFLFCFARLTNW